MGAKKSKMLLTEVNDARTAEQNLRSLLIKRDRECETLEIKLDEQKLEYEEKYLDLELKHSELQERFLELKSKFESDELSSGDFRNRANELNRKLNEALSEKDIIRIEAEKQIQALLSRQKTLEDDLHEARTKLQDEADYEEQIRCLEVEKQVLLEQSAEKDDEIQRFREENDELRSSADSVAHKWEDEFNKKGLLMRKHFNDEKVQLNKQWELKLNEIMKSYSDEVKQFRNCLVQENVSLQEKLSSALNDIDALGRKYKLLNKLFEEIRSRYERRESRKEDLERIADLEGQLIVQSEEMDRQREILKTLKFPVQQAGGNPNSRRNRRNARKQQQKLNPNVTIANNNNGFCGNGKKPQRCRKSSSSSGSSSSSEAKCDN